MATFGSVVTGEREFSMQGLPVHVLYRIRSLQEFLLYSSLFLGFAAFCMAYTTSYIQGVTWNFAIGSVLFLIVFSVYNLNRKTDEAEDELNHERRFKITKKYEKHLFYAALIGYVLALVISGFYSLLALFISLIPIISGIFYSIPLFPEQWKFRRVKEIPVAKNLVVSTAWALSFAFIPVYMAGLQPSIRTLICCIFIFSWTFIASVLPDIRDREGDAATGVSTIPVLIGIRRSRILLTAINIGFGFIILILDRLSINPIDNFVILCSIIYSQICILLIDQRDWNDFLCDVISDGQFISVAALAIILSTMCLSLSNLQII